MWMFRRNRRARMDDTGKVSIGTKIGRGVVKLQTACADRMNVLTARMPVRKLKKTLVVFCLLSGGFSIYLVMNGLIGERSKSDAVTIDQASVPKHFDESGDEVRDVQSIIDDGLLSQIKTFRSYMDSLQRHDKVSYDSIILSRPGLMDSIQTIEEIYLSQQIK